MSGRRVRRADDRPLPPFRLDMGGTDPGSTLSLGSTPEPCDIR